MWDEPTDGPESDMQFLKRNGASGTFVFVLGILSIVLVIVGIGIIIYREF